MASLKQYDNIQVMSRQFEEMKSRISSMESRNKAAMNKLKPGKPVPKRGDPLGSLISEFKQLANLSLTNPDQNRETFPLSRWKSGSRKEHSTFNQLRSTQLEVKPFQHRQASQLRQMAQHRLFPQHKQQDQHRLTQPRRLAQHKQSAQHRPSQPRNLTQHKQLAQHRRLIEDYEAKLKSKEDKNQSLRQINARLEESLEERQKQVSILRDRLQRQKKQLQELKGSRKQFPSETAAQIKELTQQHLSDSRLIKELRANTRVLTDTVAEKEQIIQELRSELFNNRSRFSQEDAVSEESTNGNWLQLIKQKDQDLKATLSKLKEAEEKDLSELSAKYQRQIAQLKQVVQFKSAELAGLRSKVEIQQFYSKSIEQKLSRAHSAEACALQIQSAKQEVKELRLRVEQLQRMAETEKARVGQVTFDKQMMAQQYSEELALAKEENSNLQRRIARLQQQNKIVQRQVQSKKKTLLDLKSSNSLLVKKLSEAQARQKQIKNQAALATNAKDHQAALLLEQHNKQKRQLQTSIQQLSLQNTQLKNKLQTLRAIDEKHPKQVEYQNMVVQLRSQVITIQKQLNRRIKLEQQKSRLAQTKQKQKAIQLNDVNSVCQRLNQLLRSKEVQIENIKKQSKQKQLQYQLQTQAKQVYINSLKQLIQIAGIKNQSEQNKLSQKHKLQFQALQQKVDLVLKSLNQQQISFGNMMLTKQEEISVLRISQQSSINQLKQQEFKFNQLMAQKQSQIASMRQKAQLLQSQLNLKNLKKGLNIQAQLQISLSGQAIKEEQAKIQLIYAEPEQKMVDPIIFQLNQEQKRFQLALQLKQQQLKTLREKINVLATVHQQLLEQMKRSTQLVSNQLVKKQRLFEQAIKQKQDQIIELKFAVNLSHQKQEEFRLQLQIKQDELLRRRQKQEEAINCKNQKEQQLLLILQATRQQLEQSNKQLNEKQNKLRQQGIRLHEFKTKIALIKQKVTQLRLHNQKQKQEIKQIKFKLQQTCNQGSFNQIVQGIAAKNNEVQLIRRQLQTELSSNKDLLSQLQRMRKQESKQEEQRHTLLAQLEVKQLQTEDSQLSIKKLREHITFICSQQQSQSSVYLKLIEQQKQTIAELQDQRSCLLQQLQRQKLRGQGQQKVEQLQLKCSELEQQVADLTEQLQTGLRQSAEGKKGLFNSIPIGNIVEVLDLNTMSLQRNLQIQFEQFQAGQESDRRCQSECRDEEEVKEFEMEDNIKIDEEYCKEEEERFRNIVNHIENRLEQYPSIDNNSLLSSVAGQKSVQMAQPQMLVKTHRSQSQSKLAQQVSRLKEQNEKLHKQLQFKEEGDSQSYTQLNKSRGSFSKVQKMLREKVKQLQLLKVISDQQLAGCQLKLEQLQSENKQLRLTLELRAIQRSKTVRVSAQKSRLSRSRSKVGTQTKIMQNIPSGDSSEALACHYFDQLRSILLTLANYQTVPAYLMENQVKQLQPDVKFLESRVRQLAMKNAQLIQLVEVLQQAFNSQIQDSKQHSPISMLCDESQFQNKLRQEIATLAQEKAELERANAQKKQYIAELSGKSQHNQQRFQSIKIKLQTCGSLLLKLLEHMTRKSEDCEDLLKVLLQHLQIGEAGCGKASQSLKSIVEKPVERKRSFFGR